MGNSHIVNGGEIYAMFHGISLIFPVVVQYDIAVCLIDWNRLEVTAFRSVTITGLSAWERHIPLIHCTTMKKRKSQSGRILKEAGSAREMEKEEGRCETSGQAYAETASDGTVASEMDSKP